MAPSYLRFTLLVLGSLACLGPGSADAPAPFRGKIVLFGAKESFASDVWRIQSLRPDGAGLETILELKLQNKGRVVTGRVAPDGRSLAYSVIPAGAVEPEIWILAAGEAPKRLGIGTVTCWSADSREVACHRQDGAAKEVRNVAVHVGTGAERKLPVRTTEIVTDWSADGQWLAVMDLNPTEKFHHPVTGEYPLRRIYLLNADGSQRTLIVEDPNADSVSPSLSHDGRVAYFRRRPQEGAIPHQFVACNRRGGAEKELGPYSKLVEGLNTYRPHGSPRWSPDSREVAWLIAPLRKESRIVEYELLFTPSDGSTSRQIKLAEHKIVFAAGMDWR
jgi:hypothetical protein